MLAHLTIGALDREIEQARAEGKLTGPPVTTTEVSAALLMAAVTLIRTSGQAQLARKLFDELLEMAGDFRTPARGGAQ